MVSSSDRVLKGILHEEPDRVPVFEPYGVMPPTADIVLKRRCIATNEARAVDLFMKRGIEAYREAIRRDWYELVRRLRFDAGPITLGTHYRPELPPRRIDEVTWSVGSSVYRHDPETGVTLEVDSDIKRGGIEALKDHVRELEDETDGEIDESVRNFLVDEEMARLWRRLDVLIYASAGTIPVGVSWFPTFLKAFYVNPQLVKRYLNERTRRVLRLARIASDLGAKLMFIGGDIAHNHGPMVSPKQYREFILPEMRAQTECLHKLGLYAFISSDGNLWPIIEDYLVNSGVDGMMEIQVTAGMDLEKLKSLFGDRICFAGSVDCQFTLVHGSLREVEEETRRVIGVLSPGGGHILCSSNSIHSGVKPRNFFRMLETARRYGIYPKKG